MRTFAVIERLNTPFILMNLCTPFVGTPVFRHPERYGVTLFADADGEEGQIDTGMVFHQTEGLSAQEIKELWIEGTGMVVSRGRERDAYEAVHWEHFAESKVPRGDTAAARPILRPGVATPGLRTSVPDSRGPEGAVR